MGLGVRMMGPVFILSFYALLSVHVYSYFEVILYVLRRRLGVGFGLLWVGIGVAIVYNIIYNHFFAMVVKPGSPSDLKVSQMHKLSIIKWLFKNTLEIYFFKFSN